MSETTLAEDVRRFVLTSIPSVPHLEALLLLRAEPRLWDAAQVAARLYISERTAALVLHDLAEVRFIEPEAPDGFRYTAESDHLTALIDRLADAYASNLVEVTKLIHERPRIRVQEFAEAFKFRKE